MILPWIRIMNPIFQCICACLRHISEAFLSTHFPTAKAYFISIISSNINLDSDLRSLHTGVGTLKLYVYSCFFTFNRSNSWSDLNNDVSALKADPNLVFSWLAHLYCFNTCKRCLECFELYLKT